MPLNNSQYFEVSGAYTGTVDKEFAVVIDEVSGTNKYKYKTRTESSDWGSFSTAATITLNTALTLEDGVQIKFTRSAVSHYNDNEYWKFTAYADLKLSEVTGDYKYIETLDIGENRNLLAITDHGEVSVVTDIDSDSATVSNDATVNIGEGSSSFDFCHNNKEMYIAKGRNTAPRWLGYTENNGLQGKDELALKSTLAMDQLSKFAKENSTALERSVVLRGGGGANSKDARIIAGFNVGDQQISILNQNNNKAYIYQIPSEALSIKRCYIFTTGSPNYYCDGFAVLRKGNGSYNGFIDLWNLNSSSTGQVGQNANKTATINLEMLDLYWTHFGDFLIVPKFADMSNTNQKFTVVLSHTRSAHTGFSPNNASGYMWLFKSDEFTYDQLTSDLILSNTIQNSLTGSGSTTSNMDDVTPQLGTPEADNTSHSTNQSHFYYIAYQPVVNYLNDTPIYQNSGVGIFPKWFPVNENQINGAEYRPAIVEPAQQSLEFGGWDGNGENPIVFFTTKMKRTNIRDNDKDLRAVKADVFGGSFGPNDSGTSYNLITEVEGFHNDSNNAFNSNALIGPFMKCGNSNTNQQRFFPIKWITWGAPINNITGRVRWKPFLHTLDFDTDESLSSLYQKVIGNPLDLISNADPSFGDDNTEGTIQRDVVPSGNPLFGFDGRFNIHSFQDNGGKSLMSYVRPGSRKLLTFRFGNESTRPMPLSDMTTPEIFPNDFGTGTNTAYDKFYTNAQTTNRYNYTDSGNKKGYGTNDNGSILRSSITGAENSDDKLSYRLCEGLYKLEKNGTGDWVPDVANDKQYIMSVPYRDHLIEQKFLQFYTDNSRTSGNSTAASNLYDSSDSAFSVSATEQTSSQNTYKGQQTKKNFYIASLVYDGYQETPLISVGASVTGTGGSNSDEILKEVQVSIVIKPSYQINDRVTSVALYRANSLDNTDTEPDGLYRFAAEIPLYQFSYNQSADEYQFEYYDRGDVEGTYEAINGISEKLNRIDINYGVITKQNGYMFAGNCKHVMIEDADNYVFRSQPGKYSIFDWSKDFIQLPFVPVALKGFMGRVYAFSNNQVAVINPDTLFIEDVIEGVGCISNRTIKVSDAGMFWCDYKNVYLASPKINSVGDAIKTVESVGWNNLTMDVKSEVRLGIDAVRKCFLLFFTNGSDHRVWLYSYKKDRWDLGQTEKKVLDTADAKDGLCYLLLDDGRIAKFMGGDARKDWEWESKKMRLGEVMVDKKIRNIKVEGNNRNKLAISYKVDGSNNYNSGTDISTNFTGDSNKAIKLATNDNGKHHWVKAKITGDNTSSGSNVKAHALSVIYKPKRPK